MTVGQLRASLHASVIGDRLVRVSATTSGPELSRRLADQTVTAYIDHVAGGRRGRGRDRPSRARWRSWRRRGRKRDRANEDVKAFLAAHPDAASADASPVDLQDLKLKELEFEQAVQRYAEAKAAQDKADLEAGTASDVARQRLVLLVPAVAAAGPDPVVKTMVLSVAVFVVLGILLSFASVVGASMLDHTIRVPADIEDRFGLDVVAVLPDMSRCEDRAASVDEAEAGGAGARLGQRQLDDELGAVGREEVLAHQHRPAGGVGGDPLAAQQRGADRHVQQRGARRLGGVGADRLRRAAQRRSPSSS